MTKLMGLNFKIVYRQGKQNVAADALSRVGHLMTAQLVTTVQPTWIQEVCNSYATDPQAQQLLSQLALVSPDSAGYSLDKGLIYYKGLIWIGSNSALQTKLIAAFHSSPLGGHSGITGTYQKLKRHFSWRGMKQDVESFVKQCSVCQQAKHTLSHPMGLLQPLPIPQGLWQDLSMDFIEGLPQSKGYSVILVVVDRLSKYSHFIALKHPYTAATVAKAFMDEVVKLHGLPQSIVSDRDTVFISHFWKEFFNIYKVNLQFSTAYHPQTDGQTERVNQCREMFLRCSVQAAPKSWKSWLSLAELWYNTNYHTALGCSPFEALYGYAPNLGAAPVAVDQVSAPVAEVIANRSEHLESLKQHLATAQNRMKQQADRHRRDHSFQVGDMVLLKLQPYTQSSVANRPYPKLAYKYFGPYKVLERVGTVAYRLQLPADASIHDVFHISQLKPFVPDYTPVFDNLPMTTDLAAAAAVPQQVVARRLVKKGNKAIPQVKILWSGMPSHAATWEDYNVIKQRFPSAPAWGQAVSSAGGGVTAEAATE